MGGLATSEEIDGTSVGGRDAKGGEEMPKTEKERPQCPGGRDRPERNNAMRRKWDSPTKHQRKQLAEIKRRTGMSMSEGMTFELARQIIDSSPVFAEERRERRAAGRRKGFVKRDAERRRRKAA